MFDTVKFSIACKHKPFGTMLICHREDGTSFIVHCRNRKSIKNAFADKTIALQIRSTNHGKRILFDGSPIKYHQGYNIFSTSDLLALITHTIYKVLDVINVTPSDAEIVRFESGDIDLERVDVFANFLLPSKEAVTRLIKMLRNWACTNIQYSETYQLDKSVYFHNTRADIERKLYNKSAEFGQHRRDKSIFNYLIKDFPAEQKQELYQIIDRLARYEIVLFKANLDKRGLNKVRHWNKAIAKSLLIESISAIPQGLAILSDEPELKLSVNDRVKLAFYKMGGDLTEYLSSQTFPDVKNRILKETGIDISVHPLDGDFHINLGEIMNEKNMKFHRPPLFKKPGLKYDFRK